MPSASETFPGFARIYRISESGGSRAFRADLELDDDRPLFKGEVKRDEPIQARWRMGSAKPGDIIWTTFAAPVLMSERVVQILRDGGFTGWDVAAPVELRGKRGEPLPTYYFLSVLGRTGPLDYSQSEPFQELMPGGWFPRLRGLYFDPATWDGSDIFRPEGTRFKFVVEPVKRALVRAKVKNLVFTRLDKIEISPPHSDDL